MYVWMDGCHVVTVTCVTCVEGAGLVSWCRAVASVQASSAVMFLTSYCAVVTVLYCVG